MKRLLRTIGYLLSIHLVALVLMTLFRIVFFFTIHSQLTPDVADRPLLILQSFLRGLWFDNVIACYLVALPLVLSSIVVILGLWRKWMYRAINIWFGVLYALVFMAEAGNIP